MQTKFWFLSPSYTQCLFQMIKPQSFKLSLVLSNALFSCSPVSASASDIQHSSNTAVDSCWPTFSSFMETDSGSCYCIVCWFLTLGDPKCMIPNAEFPPQNNLQPFLLKAVPSRTTRFQMLVQHCLFTIPVDKSRCLSHRLSHGHCFRVLPRDSYQAKCLGAAKSAAEPGDAALALCHLSTYRWICSFRKSRWKQDLVEASGSLTRNYIHHQAWELMGVIRKESKGKRTITWAPVSKGK